jgi:uncharacterized caspase-like protein
MFGTLPLSDCCSAIEPKLTTEQKQSPNLDSGHRRTVLDGNAAGMREGEPTDETETETVAECQSSPAILKSAAAPAPARGASTNAGAKSTSKVAVPEFSKAPQACCALQ